MEWFELQTNHRCFSKASQGYTYKMCLFADAKQDTVNLGSWDESAWLRNDWSDKSAPKKARFSGGRYCHWV